MGAPVTGPQDAPERGSKPAPPTSGEPVLKPTGTGPGSLCRGKPRRLRRGGCHGGSPEGFVFFESPVVARLRELGFDVWADPVQWWIRGEGGTIESFDESSETVDARFDFSEFSMTATVSTTRPTDVGYSPQ